MVLNPTKRLALVSTVIVMIAACSQVPDDYERGNLVITVSSNLGARTLDPGVDLAVVGYDLSGDGPGTESFSALGVTNSVYTRTDLMPGSWTLTATAKNAANGAIGTDSETVIIASRQTESVSLTCVPYSGTGTLNLSLSWPTAIVEEPAVQAILTPEGGSSQSLSFTLGTGTAAYTDAALANGFYTLSIKLRDEYGAGKTVWGRLESVLILSGKTTTGTWALTETDMAIYQAGGIELALASDVKKPLALTLSGNQSSLALGSTMTVTATASAGADSYQWYLNGDPLAGETNAATTIGTGLTVGPYWLDVLAKKDGATGSVGFRFSVANDISLSKDGGVTLVDLPSGIETGAKISQTPDNNNFYLVGISGGFYDTNKHAFAAKFDSAGAKQWEWISGELAAAPSNFGGYLSSAADDAGNIYLVIIDTTNTFRIKKIGADGAATPLWERTKAVSAGYLNGYGCIEDGSGGLWIAGSTGSGSEERVYYLHYNSAGDLLAENTWGGSRCAAMSICSDGGTGYYITGFANDTPSDALLLHLDASGNVDFNASYGASYDYDIKPKNIVLRGDSIFIGAAKADSSGNYVVVVLEYDVGIRAAPVFDKEIALPSTVFYNSESWIMIGVPMQIPMKVIGNNIVVGYGDSSALSGRSLAIINAADTVNWSIFDGDNPSRESSMTAGIYYNPTGKYIITESHYNVPYSDNPVLSFSKWNILP